MSDGLSLRARLDDLPALRSLVGGSARVLAGVPQGAVGLVAWWLRQSTGRHVLLVAADAEGVYGDCVPWCPDDGLNLFPGADTLPFDRVPPGEEVTRRRLGTLAALGSGGPQVVVASPAGLLRRTLAPALVREGALSLRSGDLVAPEVVVRRLLSLGYRRAVAVSAPGEFAVRGGIIDVFGLDRSRPWRAEWFGDQVDELRAFEVETQTSVSPLAAVEIWPARELDFRPEAAGEALRLLDGVRLETCRPEVRESWERDRERLELGAYDEGVDLFAPYLSAYEPATLLEHLGPDALVLHVGGRERTRREGSRHLDEVEALRTQEEGRGELPEGALSGMADVDAVWAGLDQRRHLDVVRETSHRGDVVDLGWTGVEGFAGRFEALAPALRRRMDAGHTVLLLSRQGGRVDELLREQGLDPVDLADLDAESGGLPSGACINTYGEASAGFSAPAAALEVYTDHELFGLAKRRGSPLSRGARRALSTSSRGNRSAATGTAAAKAFSIQFQPGDLVVHRDHGIGRFLDMRRVSGDDGEHEYMTLEYSDGNRLFVPVAHLDRVDRYIGGSDSAPTLSRLGTGEWERVKRRVKERTEEVARELIGLYSRREAAEGHAFLPDGAWQRELEASFPYQETADQELVLEEIKRDMETSKPMDRVVCGDVGFGKTELALRAAFKAAVEGRQVAVLVPTTVLAQQHFTTFSSRLAAFPVTVRQLSRFCSEDEIRETLAGCRSGGVDIVVGTHRLLQKDVHFHNLGLVIIDEEQRFGVLQKERFKELRVAVDVLSLSATPIPRTLHMSLAGIRDLSVIQSPPEERQPIKTYVTAREDGLVAEVIGRELARAGQVFYLHNRVQTIQIEADRLRELLPDVRIAIGHGQMPEGALAQVMRQFADGEIDVLVCTTIIESGLDISNANTIVVNDAQRFGLAQLYQLRGRVGRSGQRAYAYFLYPPDRSLTERADKRLDVITDLQDLGAGVRRAMRDLELRGAGNLLGEEQHGEIAAVGMELYNHLLGQAVGALQGKTTLESPAQVSVNLPVAAYLPPAYVQDERLRLRCYQDLAACATETELDRRARGLNDRFGPLPAPAEDLIFSLRVRMLAALCGANAVEGDAGSVVVQFPIGHGLDLELVAGQFRSTMTASPTRLRLSSPEIGTGTRSLLRQERGGGATPRARWRETLVAALRELGRLSRTQRRAVPA
ncbi:MAG: transcription-repair coupling factor [Candidatus Dormibacteria bacterium]